MGSPLEPHPDRIKSMDPVGSTLMVYDYKDGSMAVVRLDTSEGDYIGIKKAERLELAVLILGEGYSVVVRGPS